MKILSTLLLLLLSINQTLADTEEVKKDLREYDVEIIIFEDIHARYINSETWDQFADPETLPAKSGTNKKNNNVDFTDIETGIIKQEYNRINRSSEYKVLFYGAWRQVGLESKKAFELQLDQLLNKHKPSKKYKSTNTINGYFKVVLARYLHFYSKLDYQRNSDETINEPVLENKATNEAQNKAQQDNLKQDELAQKSNIYPMNIHRRMRSKELHYIDHPLVGILIQINPVKKVEEAEDAKES